MSVAGIEAVSCVLLTNCVVRCAPFHQTVEELRNPVPLTVRVNAAPPTVTEFGLRLVIVGAGLLMAKLRLFDVPPPGEGLVTSTIAVPAVARSLAKIVAVN